MQNGTTSLIGRTSEIQYLEAWLRTALTIKRGVLLLSGPAGMGKSQLLQEACRLVKPAVPPLILHGSSNQQNPYQIFAQWLLSRFIGHSSLRYKDPAAAFLNNYNRFVNSLPVRRRNELKANGDYLLWLSGLTIAPELRQLDPKTLYDLSASALKSLLVAEAELFPLVIIVKNVHLVDIQSAQFLAKLSREGIIVAMTKRSDGNWTNHSDALLAMVDAKLELPPLALHETRQLVHALSQTLDCPLMLNESVIETIYQSTSGIPFLIEQMTLLLQQNMLCTSDKVAVDLYLRDRPQNVIDHRLGQLSPVLRLTIEAAAVCGLRFSKALLERVMTTQYLLSAHDCISNIHQGIVEGFWHASSEGEYLFNELLFRDSVLETMQADKNRLLHQACAASLQELYAPNAAFYAHEIAAHLEYVNQRQAARWYETSANIARKEYRHHQAMEYYDRALTLLPQDNSDIRFELLRHKAESAEQAAKLDQAETGYQTILAASRQSENRYEESWALSGLGHLADLHSDRERALELLQQALQLARDSGNNDAAMITWGRIGMVLDAKQDWNGAREAYQQKLVMAQTSANNAAIISSLNNIGLVYLGENKFSEAINILQQLTERLETDGDQVILSKVFGNLAYAYDEKGLIDSAIDAYKRQLELAGKYGYQLGVSIALCGLGATALKKGQLSEALIRLKEAVAIGKNIGVKYYTSEYNYFYARALQLQGQYALALNIAEQSLEEALADEREDITARTQALLLGLRADSAVTAEDRLAAIKQLAKLSADPESKLEVRAFAALELQRKKAKADSTSPPDERCIELFYELYADTGRDEYARILAELQQTNT